MSTIRQKLDYLNDTKYEIRQAIISRNVSIDDSDTFRSYAEKIKSIPIAANYNVEPLNATENKEYNAGENKAYNPVTVNVRPNVKTKNITDVGTFKASDDDADGYSQVTVDMSSKLKAKNITSTDMPDEPTEKITFEAGKDAKDDDDKNYIGFSKVSIDMSGRFQEKPIDVDTTNYGAQFTYEAKDDGLYGYSKVVITVKESDGPFTVEFWDDQNRLLVVPDVPKYGSATYKNANTGENTPSKTGYRFKGWNPMPTNVTRNISCYAQWEKTSSSSSSSATEDGKAGNVTNRSWNEIGQTGGDDIPIGSTKNLYYSSLSYDGIEIDGGFLKMRKIYRGERGTTSTWLSVNPLPLKGGMSGYRFWPGGEGGNTYKKQPYWDSPFVTGFLNSFIGCLGAANKFTDDDASSLSNLITTVNKPCAGFAEVDLEASTIPETVTEYSKSTSCKLWLPSIFELSGSDTVSPDSPEEIELDTGCVKYNPGSDFFKLQLDESKGESVTLPTQCVTRSYTGSYSRALSEKTFYQYGKAAQDSGYPDGQLVAWSLSLRNYVANGSYTDGPTNGWYEEPYVTAFNEYYSNREINPESYTPGRYSKIYIGFCTG